MHNETLCGNEPAAAPDDIARGLPRCLACRHENPKGEKFCQACGSSLYLVLCGACEAVNGAGALCCHSCGAALHAEASDKPAAAPSRARISGGRLAWMLAALVVTAGFAYQYFPRSPEADRSQVSGVVKTVPVEAFEPPSLTALPSKKSGAGAPAAGASASVTPASRGGPAHTRVTHTRATESSSTAPSSAVAPTAPEARQNSAVECGEAVAALGLCNISQRTERR